MSQYLSNDYSCRLTNFNTSQSSASFNRLACAKCYELLQYVFKDFNSKSEYNMTNDGYLISVYNSTQVLDLSQEKDADIMKGYLDPLEFKKWDSCCSEAKLCCSNVMSVSLSDMNQSCSAVCFFFVVDLPFCLKIIIYNFSLRYGMAGLVINKLRLVN